MAANDRQQNKHIVGLASFQFTLFKSSIFKQLTLKFGAESLKLSIESASSQIIRTSALIYTAAIFVNDILRLVSHANSTQISSIESR